MAHPNGGQGNRFSTKHSFSEAYAFVGKNGTAFSSTTGERIRARQGTTRDGETPTIVFMGEKNRHGSVCHACWGFRGDCSGTRIGQCSEALDAAIPEGCQ